MKNLLFCMAFFALLCPEAFSNWYDNADWHDDFYQYRIPLEVNVTQSGLQQLNISEEQIVTLINATEDVPCTWAYFEFNNVTVVEYDASGNLVGELDTGTYFISEDGPNLVYNGGFELDFAGWVYYAPSFSIEAGASYNGSKALKVDSDTVDKNRAGQGPFATIPGDWYMLKYWSKAQQNTYNTYVNITKSGYSSGPVKRTSHIPSLASFNWTQYRALYHADEPAIQINIYRTITGVQYFDDIEMHHADIELLIAPGSTGLKRYMLYYQPTDGKKPNIPRKEIAAQPGVSVTPSFTGAAQRYENLCRYTLESNPDYDIFFAETTQKLSPHLATPSLSKPAINISCAQNEQQSFQLVLNPKSTMNVTSVTPGDLMKGTDVIPAAKVRFKQIEYHTMAQPSEHAHGLTPVLADALVDFSARSLNAGDPSLPLWFTIAIDSSVNPGTYSGTIDISGDIGGTPFVKQIAVNLRIYAFALPERLTFQTSHGGSHMGYSFDGGLTVYDYHGVTTDNDKRTVRQNYYDYMVDNRVCPFTFGEGVEYKINPPAEYNVDFPGNFFYLYDFDFTEFNASLSRYIDDKKANAFTIGHTNGDVCNRFNTPIGSFIWGESPGPPYTEVTQLQFNNLILDYYREVAINLILNGWIDYTYISFDETSVDGFGKMINFIDTLGSDFFASQIKIQADLNRTAPYTYKTDPGDTEIAFKDRIDIWTPNNNELGNFHENYYYTEHGLDLETTEKWLYYSHSPHTYIDVLGVTNRLQPVKAFFMHCKGWLTWASVIWERPGTFVQPWIDPWCTWGNGVLAYFYPPLKTGPSPVPNFDIIPSLRIELFREGIEDFEYLTILEDAMAGASGMDTSTAESLLAQYRAMFPDWVHWSTNDEYYVRIRNQIGEEIEYLLLGSADSDGDGMTDLYEIIFGLDHTDDGTINIDNGPDGNPDSDSKKNIAEFTAWTDPKDPESFFESEILYIAPNNVEIRVEGHVGRIYKLYKSNGPLNPVPVWIEQDVVEPVSDGTIIFTDINSSSMSLYKVSVELKP